MRIVKSKMMLDEEYKNILVKEFSTNYQGVNKLVVPADIVQVMMDVFHISDMAEEYVYLLAMTAKCKPISFFEISHGTCDGSLVGIREIMIRALLCGAVNIIIIHNHPSGSPTPSEKDMLITKRLKMASDIIGIHFCDHIIVARDGFFSFREAEMLEE